MNVFFNSNTFKVPCRLEGAKKLIDRGAGQAEAIMDKERQAPLQELQGDDIQVLGDRDDSLESTTLLNQGKLRRSERDDSLRGAR